MKVAVFDFCETLVDFQTANRFVEYCYTDNNFIKSQKFSKKLLFRFISQNWVRKILDKLFPAVNLSKRIYIYTLKGSSAERIEELSLNFYLEEIKPFLNVKILQLLIEHIENSDVVVLASGGYDVYLKHFASEFKIKNLICTKLKVCDGQLKGSIDGQDCLNKYKLDRVEKLVTNLKLLEYSRYVYTDSISDLPLLLWSNERFVVSKKCSQIWVKEYNFTEIII